ncbi:MAG: prephenate dehydrogenase/arogenate dehydrogenase family protein [Acidobacteriota bacterium]
MPTARHALIAGLGLIGGSIGIALRRAGWRVSFDDPNVALDEARAAGAADDDDRQGADVVILAMPVDAAVDVVRRAEARPTLTSVCSVMGPLRAVADASHVSFVAGHPLAGSERRGLVAARGDLFVGKPWFVDRDEQLVADIIDACGARSERVSAEEHDRAVALTSHLPQVLSTALATVIGERGGLERFAGSGLKTFLRLAESDAAVWMPVLAANRENIAPHLDALMDAARAILDGDADAFARAKALVRRLS